MISRLQEAFEHASRFSADASHELRTPLTILRGELEAALQSPALGGEVREKIGSALEEIDRLSKVVEGLFAISHLDTGEATLDVKRFDLAHLAATTAEQMAPLAQEKQIVLVWKGSECVEIDADRGRIKQVAVNLIDNAIKYTPEGGRIEVEARSLPDRNEAVLEVIDTGSGIAPEALPHIFDRFYRSAEARSGTNGGAGIGLSIVRSICAAHGGRIEVENRPGKNGHPAGAVFRAILPLAVQWRISS